MLARLRLTFCVPQRGRQLGKPVILGFISGSSAIRVLNRRVSALIQQKPHNCFEAVRSRDVQAGFIEASSSVDISSGANETLNHLERAALNRTMKRRRLHVVPDCHRNAHRQDTLGKLAVAAKDRRVQRRATCPVGNPDVVAVIEQEGRGPPVAKGQRFGRGESPKSFRTFRSGPCSCRNRTAAT